MKISKKIASLIAAFALAVCMSVTALATNEADDSLAMSNVNDISSESSEAAETTFDGLTFAGETPLSIAEANEEDVKDLEDEVKPVDEGWSRKTYTYDIHGEADGPVDVSVAGMIDAAKLSENGEYEVQVYHLLDDGGIETLDATIDDEGNVSFTTSSFSAFYFTVDFRYNGDVVDSYQLKVGSSTNVKTLIANITGTAPSEALVSAALSPQDDKAYVKISADNKNATLYVDQGFSGTRTLTAKYGSNTYSIELRVQDIFYYLYQTEADGSISEGEDIWCMDVEKRSVVDIAEGNLGEYIVNTAPIDVTDVTGGAVFYVRPGAVLEFTTGWKWPALDGKDYFKGNYTKPLDHGYWTWSQEDGNNLLMVDSDIKGVTTFTVPFFATDTATASRLQYDCEITVHVIPEYTPRLLENTEHKDDIRVLPVTLYNYDGVAWREHYTAKDPNTRFIEFGNASSGVASTIVDKTGINYGGYLMGLLENTLDSNGLPHSQFGQDVDLFSDGDIVTENNVYAKKVYDDVDFQFVYDENTGYYTYASQLNAAQFFENENTIKLYRENLAATDGGASVGCNNAGFYPFVDVTEAFLGVYGSTGVNSTISGESSTIDTRDTAGSAEIVSNTAKWKEALGAGYKQYSGYLVRDLVNTTDVTGLSNVDMHFGLSLTTQFYVNSDKKDENGEDLIFQFTGDDDLWVFVDGKLVLDLGGRHGPISGVINFTKGTVEGWDFAQGQDGTTTRYYLTGVNTTEKVTGNYKGTFSCEGDQMHTLSIFYLERDSGHSNCYMRFNVPVVPSNAVTVSKEVAASDGSELSVTPNTDYVFQLQTRNVKNNDQSDNEFTPLSSASYTVEGEDGAKTTSSDGTFTLKAGQTATFKGVERFTEVRAVECKPKDNYRYTSSKVSISKKQAESYTYDTETSSMEMLLGGGISFEFTNYVEAEALTIEKSVVGGTSGLVDPSQKFEITLSLDDIMETGEGAIEAVDSAGNTVFLTNEEKFELACDGLVTIASVPIGASYTVEELNPDPTYGSFDSPVYALQIGSADPASQTLSFGEAFECEIEGDSPNKVVVTNQQRFNLTIKKFGIAQPLDDDSEGSVDDAEYQSTVFTVSRADGFSLDVVVHANGSATIKGLPVGTYVVTENTDWSWRYVPAVANQEVKPSSVTNGAVAVKFSNSRQRTKWLSGDNWCANLFAENAITQITGAFNASGSN